MQFYTRFAIEKSYDEAQIQVSTNNGVTYSPLCGKYETSPASFDGTYPVYDGRQDEWVKEDIDLSDYLGQNIKIRFTLDADFYDEKDGFYFDDLLIRKLTSNTVGVGENVLLNGDFSISPNPSDGSFNLYNRDAKEIDLTIYNSLGQIILTRSNVNEANFAIELGSSSPGIYFLKLRTGQEEVVKKLVLEK